MTNLREKILDYIVKIQIKETKENVPITTKRLLYENGIYHLEINNIKIRKTSEYLVKYICSGCKVETSVGTTQILRKIRNGVLPKCLDCLSIIIQPMQTPLQKKEIHRQSIQEFEEKYNDLFKKSYILSHLTEEDFERIRNNIISFCNGKYTDLNNYEFWSIYKVNNQMRFSSVIYDKKNDCIFKADQPIITCDNCSKSWRCKSLEKFKNDYKLICPECKLYNRTFKICSIKNINNENIMYQSKLELKFIRWCNNNNILVNNCSNILSGKVDFQINDYLIEIKGLIWHKDDYKLQKNYFFITPQNWNQQTKELLILLQKI